MNRYLDTVKMAKARDDGYHHGDLRRALLRGARKRLEREGVEGLSLRMVAAEAGVSHAAPYHHFADRDALVAALAAEGFDGLTQALAAADAAPARTTRARLVELGVAYVGFARANPALFRLMFGPILGRKASYPELLASAGAALAVLQNAVTRVVGERKAPEGTLASWSLIHGLATLRVDGALVGVPLPTNDDAELARKLGTLLAAGLTSGARPPTSSPGRSRPRA
jgi:AcrR family transcriptional regulator